MQKGTKYMLGAAAMAYVAALVAIHPHTQGVLVEGFKNAAEWADLREPDIAPEKPRAYIKAGYTIQDKEPVYMPDKMAQACSKDNMVASLSYGLALVRDDREEEVRANPLVGHDDSLYLERRAGDAHSFMQGNWQEIASGMAADELQKLDLQEWLGDQARGLNKQEGLKVSFRVNAARGVDSRLPLDNAIDVCTPEDQVTPPIEGTHQAPGQRGHRPF